MTTTTKNNFLVTKENFNQIAEAIAHMKTLSANYNRDCFGSSDLRLAMRMEELLESFIVRVMDSGYCAHALMDTMMRKYGMWILETSKRPEHKQELDGSLLIDVSDLSSDIDYCVAVFEEYSKF